MKLGSAQMFAGLLTAIGATALVAAYSDVQTLAEDDVSSATDHEVSELTGFTSPSGNIGCYIDPSSARCDIRERNWAPPPKAADCPAETGYGQGIVLRAGVGASFVCAGDTALSSGPPLAYGDSITAGSLECRSLPSGMNCWDFQYGHEFTLSQESYQLS